jgi:hypothetical protein
MQYSTPSSKGAVISWNKVRVRQYVNPNLGVVSTGIHGLKKQFSILPRTAFEARPRSVKIPLNFCSESNHTLKPYNLFMLVRTALSVAIGPKGR